MASDILEFRSDMCGHGESPLVMLGEVWKRAVMVCVEEGAGSGWILTLKVCI